MSRHILNGICSSAISKALQGFHAEFTTMATNSSTRKVFVFGPDALLVLDMFALQSGNTDDLPLMRSPVLPLVTRQRAEYTMISDARN